MPRYKKTSLRIYPDNWISHCNFNNFFNNPNLPLEVDIGSGKGRFINERARRFPNINFLGIERQLLRLNRCGRKCELDGRKNIRFLRMEGSYALKYLIPINYISNYYFFFPDPWPKDRHHHNRIFKDSFIDSIFLSLKVNGSFHIATDHQDYFNEMLTLLKKDKRFSESETLQLSKDEITDFEIMFYDRKINRCSFKKTNK
ncbi:MAG: tRNA (guanosine(46)-N7)-methyltransferase TrmB [Pontiellaceae bacterium]